MIEQLARDYFRITPEQPVHVNAWAASQRAYDRKLYNEAQAAEKAAKAVERAARAAVDDVLHLEQRWHWLQFFALWNQRSRKPWENTGRALTMLDLRSRRSSFQPSGL